jgi:translation initiation factor 2 subunit 2
MQPEEDPMAIFATMKKLKKKPKAPANEPMEADLEQPAATEESPSSQLQEGEESWLQSDRDYTYQELLSRITKILRANNPELAGEKKKINMVLPVVNREGSKKSAFVNVVEVCKRLNRASDHVIQFLLAELGTTGSTDATNSLIIRGRFQQKQIEAVIKRYVQEYVQCKTCKSPDTVLIKENRLYFHKCEVCGSSRTVSAIKSGFKAQTEKRSAQRNKLQ